MTDPPGVRLHTCGFEAFLITSRISAFAAVGRLCENCCYFVCEEEEVVTNKKSSGSCSEWEAC